MKKNTKVKLRAALTSVVVMAVFLSGCEAPIGASEDASEEAEVDERLEVSVASPVVREITISSNFAGEVVAEGEVDVIPLLGGEVVEKNYEVGDHVNEGDLLFRIDDEALQIALKQAEATVTQAQAGLSTAQANLNSSEANANTTRAKAIEEIGTIPYNEKTQDYNVDKAYVGKRSANNTFKNAKDSVEACEDALDEAKDDRDDAEHTRDVAKDDYEKETDPTLKAQKKLTYDNAQMAYELACDGVDSAESALDRAKRTADDAEMNYNLAAEGYELTEMQRNNYNTYTKATSIFDAYATAVGADSSVTSSKANVTSSSAVVKSAQAGLENAKLNLEHASVKAPVSGTITAINVSLHNMASMQSVAYTIESDQPHKIVFYVAEETARNIIPGADALVSKNGVEYAGKIINVYDTLDPTTGLFKVEASVSDPAASESLISGASVSIKTITRRSGNSLTVPINAVYYDGDQAYVYTNANGVAKRTDVTCGLSDEESIEITAGLTPEDKVVVSWAGSLRDGAQIKASDISAGSDNNESKAMSPATGDMPAMVIVAGAGEP